jgi:hypothetical protein
VTVSGILPHFGADRVGLSAKEYIVVSSFSVFGVEECAVYSGDFLFSEVVLFRKIRLKIRLVKMKSKSLWKFH